MADNLEIERKFLLRVPNPEKFFENLYYEEISQGYLVDIKAKKIALRVRTIEPVDFAKYGAITVKGPSEVDNANEEYEMDISFEIADALLNTCEIGITKTRYYFTTSDGMCWEIDQFHGALEGMWIAELELPDANYQPAIPAWIGTEVSKVPEFKNIVLAHAEEIPDVYWELMNGQ